jgi:hypothetical protein
VLANSPGHRTRAAEFRNRRSRSLRVLCPAPNQFTEDPPRRPFPPFLRNSRWVESCLDRLSEQIVIARRCGQSNPERAESVILGSSRRSSTAPVQLDELREIHLRPERVLDLQFVEEVAIRFLSATARRCIS